MAGRWWKRSPLSHRLGPTTTPFLKMVLDSVPSRAGLVPAPNTCSPVGARRLSFTPHSRLRACSMALTEGVMLRELHLLLDPGVEQTAVW